MSFMVSLRFLASTVTAIMRGMLTMSGQYICLKYMRGRVNPNILTRGSSMRALRRFDAFWYSVVFLCLCIYPEVMATRKCSKIFTCFFVYIVSDAIYVSSCEIFIT